MRLSQYFLATLKETPADAELVSHQLMLRAGLIRKLATGVYSWLPPGLRVVRRVEAIIREEMNRAGAQELLMPAVQPAELWQESGRWDLYGPELLRLKDRHQREFCFGPTHEEVITDLVRGEIRSYKQLPVNFYQIQTKFRDEIRPRFGVMRAREFVMKDAYSFHLDDDSLQDTYRLMYDTYQRIFTRIGLDFRAVAADTGAIGGNVSHEFHVLADSGEDAIAFSDQSDYAANVELAASLPPTTPRPVGTRTLTKVATPGRHSIEDVSDFLGLSPDQCVKTLVLENRDGKLIAVVLRGDHELNLVKLSKLEQGGDSLQFAAAPTIRTQIGCAPGSLGPVGLTIPVLVDHAAAQLADFACGANEDGQHLTGVNWGRDLPVPQAVDIRNVVEGDPSPDHQGRLTIRRGIEVGHIFQLGRKYTEAMGVTCLAESGKAVVMTMGCYGIGVTRIVAAAIEQNHDGRGIIWPEGIAPFSIALLALNSHKSQRLRGAAESLYEELCQAGFEVLFDDRKERPGIMFADSDLLGIPHRLVLSERGLDAGEIEYKHRRAADSELIPLSRLQAELKSRLGSTD